MEMNERNGAITAGLTTGIIGTVLGAAGAAGGAGSLLGFHSGTGNQYVSKEAYDVQLKLIESERNNAVLAADLASEKKMVEVYNAASNQIRELEKKVDANIAAQGVVNANVASTLNLHTNQIEQLMGMTKLVIPNASISPGWES